MQSFKEYFYQVYLESQDIDKPYFDAIENQDEQTLRKLVNQKAIENGYNIGPVYHGSNYHAYHPKERLNWFNTANERGAAFFSSDIEVAKEYGIKVYPVSLKSKNPFKIMCEGKNWTNINSENLVVAVTTPELNSAIEKRKKDWDQVFSDLDELRISAESVQSGSKIRTLGNIPGLDNDTFETDKICKTLRKYGYDLIIFSDVSDSPTVGAGYSHKVATTYAVFNSRNIKEMNIVEYDDSGEIIPLSKRFDSSTSDMRY